jgi:hypothetical protein
MNEIIKRLNWPKGYKPGWVPWYQIAWRLWIFPITYILLLLACVSIYASHGTMHAKIFWHRNA